MPRRPKPYVPILEWAEDFDDKDPEWPTLNYCTNYGGHQYHLCIRMRNKWWRSRERFCTIDIFVDEGMIEDQPNIIFGHFFSNLRKMDPYRYKDMALKWAEDVIVSPMTRLANQLDQQLSARPSAGPADEKPTQPEDKTEILTDGKKV